MMDGALKDLLSQLFNVQALGVLSTAVDYHPYSNLVAFTALGDLRSIVFVTPRSTVKYRNLAANVNVSLLIDNRSNTPTDFDQALVVTALGQASEVSSDECEALKDLHRKKHPALYDFISSAECALFQMKVTKYILVRSLQDVSIHAVN